MKEGLCSTTTPDYKRLGTTLFTTLNVLHAHLIA